MTINGLRDNIRSMTTQDASDLQIVTTPTFDWVAENARACRSQMLVASPYVNSRVIGITNLAPAGVTCRLVTRTDLRDFAAGSSSLEALCTLARNGVVVSSLGNLHAKMYIFDDVCALMTSANATNSGMHRNLECGLATRNAAVVARLCSVLLRGFESEIPRVMTVPALETLRLALPSTRASMPVHSPASAPVDAEPKFSVIDPDGLLSGFRGWTKLTLRGVMSLPEGDFRLDGLARVCEPLAVQQYPKNRHVHAKLRQQLQILRNHGVIQFVNNQGVYRRTMSEQRPVEPE